MAIKDVARAFAYGQPASCHNAHTDGKHYYLHGNLIACKKWREDEGGGVYVVFDWCGWYGPTTANHMNHILKAWGEDKRVSYALHRDTGITTFVEA